jgi:hypothetical protein
MRHGESLNLGAGRALEPKTPIFMAGSVAINSLKNVGNGNWLGCASAALRAVAIDLAEAKGTPFRNISWLRNDR